MQKGGTIQGKVEGWPSSDEGPDPELMLTRSNVPGDPPRPCCLGVSPSRREALYILYILDPEMYISIETSRSFLVPIFLPPKPNAQFPTFRTVELFWDVLQPSAVPFDDNGGERIGTLLRLGIAVRSTRRRPPRFYPARTSSALESCSVQARLPSSPQVVSESHPPVICCWLGFPPDVLGVGKKPQKTIKKAIETTVVGGSKKSSFWAL